MSDLRRDVRWLVSSARAFLRHFNPCNLAEDKSQQWQALSHQCDVVERALSAQPQPEAVEPFVQCADCAASQPEAVEADWRDDPTSDERWSAGLDFAMIQLCAMMGVDPHDVTWDAATEEVEGDVRAVIWNILRAKMGEDWKPEAPPIATDERMRMALEDKLSKLTPENIHHMWRQGDLYNWVDRLKNSIREALRADDASNASAEARLREFAGGFKFSVSKDSFYQDAYLSITRPDRTITFRLGNGRQFSADIVDLEDRRLAALSAGGDEAKKSEGSPANPDQGLASQHEYSDESRSGRNSSRSQSAPSDPTPSEQREAIARVIDPRAFIIVNSKRADIQNRQQLALGTADAILALSTRAGG